MCILCGFGLSGLALSSLGFRVWQFRGLGLSVENLGRGMFFWGLAI